MKKSEKIFLAAFLVMGLMVIVFMNRTPRAVDSIISKSSITLFPTTETIKKSIVQTFQNGNVAYCKMYFTPEVTLSIETMEGEYTAEETAIKLDTFFVNNPPKSFRIKHEGTNKSKTEKFWIGEYESINDDLFSIYINSDRGKIYSVEIAAEALNSFLLII